MSARSMIIALLLSMVIGFSGTWLYIQGFEEGTEQAGLLSPSDYVARRQQWVTTEPEATEQAQSSEPQDEESPTRQASDDEAPIEATDPESIAERLCVTDWRNLAQLELDELAADLRARETLLSQQCSEAMLRTEVTPVLENLILNCVGAIASLQTETLENLCVEGLPQLKAYATRRLGEEALTLDRSEEAILREQLVGAFINLGTASEEELQQDLQMAEQLIAENPDSYIGYKAKLVALLLNETKFENSVPIEEYMALYDEMLRFGDEVTEETSLGGPLESSLGGAPEVGDLDPDLVHIPFLRLSALGEYAEMEAMAEDYIEAYPNSYIGYLYGAESLWRSGQREAAIDALRSVFPAQESDDALYTLFEQFQRLTPVDRVEQMGLGVN